MKNYIAKLVKIKLIKENLAGALLVIFTFVSFASFLFSSNSKVFALLPTTPPITPPDYSPD